MEGVTWLDVFYAYLGVNLFAFSHAINLIELIVLLVISNGLVGLLQWFS